MQSWSISINIPILMDLTHTMLTEDYNKCPYCSVKLVLIVNEKV